MSKVKPFILSLLTMGQFYPHFFVNIKTNSSDIKYTKNEISEFFA